MRFQHQAIHAKVHGTLGHLLQELGSAGDVRWVAEHGHVGHLGLQCNRDFPHWGIAKVRSSVARKPSVQRPNFPTSGFCNAFDGAHPQLQVGVHRIFDQQGEVCSSQGISKGLHGEWTDRGSCPNPKCGHARLQCSFNMRRGCDFSHGLQARLSLCFHEPSKPHFATTLEAVGSCARFPKSRAQEVNLATGCKLPCGVQDLRPRFCTAWPRNHHGFAITPREGVNAS